MKRLACAIVLFCATTAPAQWSIQDGHTSADLRGIHALDNGIAWASGTDGTILRTTNDGKHWQRCTTPPGAEHLDFRGIQAFDANTAIVMSSGKGPLSRLYKTTNGCRTWKLLFTNPDPDGFWAAIMSSDKSSAMVLGNPMNGRLQLFDISESVEAQPSLREITTLAGPRAGSSPMTSALRSETSFPASNSSLIRLSLGGIAFATGGAIAHPRVIGTACISSGDFIDCTPKVSEVPMATGPTAGVFSLAAREFKSHCPSPEELAAPLPLNPLVPGPRCQITDVLVAVGGDLARPADSSGTAAYTEEAEDANHYDPSDHWHPAQTPPHGFRSSVAYDPSTSTWITVGPNGTDISTDDGRNWRPLRPAPTDARDADQHWNALSLPFVVGSHGRIGKLNSDRLKGSN